MADEPNSVKAVQPDLIPLSQEKVKGPADFDGRKVIGIHGSWYDITDFIPLHPGGQFLTELIGKDATAQFIAFHNRKDVFDLKLTPILGSYDMKEYNQRPKDPADKKSQIVNTAESYKQLNKKFTDMGLMETSFVWYAQKTLVAFACLFLSAVLMVRSGRGSPSPQLYWFLLGTAGFCLGLFWQQCTYIMHELEHGQVFRNRTIDLFVGCLFATLGCGYSGMWWRDEHFLHHAFPMMINYKSGFYDYQMREITWMQSPSLRPTFFKSSPIINIIQRILISIQGWTYLPINLLCGRFLFIIDSYFEETHPMMWIGAAAHWAWTIAFLRFAPSVEGAMFAYFIGMVAQGLLHVQLMMNHYTSKWLDIADLHTSDDWCRHQVHAAINLNTPWWIDWFHGGLNFHIEHHLFPRAPRHSFRAMNPYIKDFCKENGLTYREESFFGLLFHTVGHMWNCLSTKVE